MARISGIDLPNKHTAIALTYIHGIGHATAAQICDTCRIEKNRRINDLSMEEINTIRKFIDNNCAVEGRLRTARSMAIKRLIDIQSYRGIRHRKGLPVRGQRTQTNARTRRSRHKGAVTRVK